VARGRGGEGTPAAEGGLVSSGGGWPGCWRVEDGHPLVAGRRRASRGLVGIRSAGRLGTLGCFLLDRAL
jgi:hypothetical protein